MHPTCSVYFRSFGGGPGELWPRPENIPGFYVVAESLLSGVVYPNNPDHTLNLEIPGTSMGR